MRRRFRRNLAVILTVGVGLTACTTPHHSNALIFGTNTSLGLEVGPNATGAPAIVVGYRRQEAVFMPLVATAQFDAHGNHRPCTIGPNGAVSDPTVLPPCILVGRNGAAIDSYSVLASFGAQFEADTQGSPSASGGLAQFFATGIAAQLLAIRGGPALVATGNAALATGASDSTGELQAAYGAPAVTEYVTTIRTGIETNRPALSTYIATSTDTNFVERLTRLETEANAPVGSLTSGLCRGGGRDACLVRLNTESGERWLGLNNLGWKAAIDRLGGATQ